MLSDGPREPVGSTEEERTAPSRHPSSHLRRPRKKAPPDLVLGWREWVTLPGLGVDVPVKAKVDTGAATSALHAHRLRIEERDGIEWACFEVHPRQRSSRGAVLAEVPVKSWRNVRSSNGKRERRPVIKTRIGAAGRVWAVEFTLARRDQMGFRMLLGRQAIRGRAVVDVSRSYLGTKLTPSEES